ncbi:MAG: hypothetical protein AAFZ65_14485 [Planctomycetota bacterium]
MSFPEGRPVIDLAEARRAFERDDLDTCLQACGAALDGSPSSLEEADWAALRDQALTRVRARAEQSPGSGGARWLGLLVRHDPRAAQSVHLGWQQADTDSGSEAGAPPAPSRAPGSSSVHFEPCLVGPAHGFSLTVDEAGEFQCVVADELTFGAEPSPQRPPARLHAVAALRGGRTWRVEPGVVDVTVDGELVSEVGATVRAGQRVAVAAGDGGGPTCFRLRTAASSESLRLDFERGLERDRSVNVLLVANGRGGRLRIGGRRSFLVHTPGLDGSLELWVEGRRLFLRGSDPVAVAASSDAGRQRRLEPGAAIEFALPLLERVDVQVRGDEPGRAPSPERTQGPKQPVFAGGKRRFCF